MVNELPKMFECVNCSHKKFWVRITKEKNILAIICQSCGKPYPIRGWAGADVIFL